MKPHRTYRLPTLLRRGPAWLLATLALAACGGEEAGSGEPSGDSPQGAGDAASPGLPGTPPELEDLGHARGSENAPITVVEFSDFGCPYCATFHQDTYPAIHEEFVSEGEIRWIYVPFVLGSFPNGELAARAGECAALEGGFWEMKDALYEAQSEWRGTSRGEAPELFRRLAESVGGGGEGFATCLKEDRVGERIGVHNEAARAVGVRATPSFVVEGHLLEGALPPEQFRMVLEQVAEMRQ